MKQNHLRPSVRILLPLFLVLTVFVMLLPLAAEETAVTEQNAAARVTVSSVKTGETVETLYAAVEEARAAAENAAGIDGNTVTLKLLKQLTGYIYADSYSMSGSLTLDLGGFHHYIHSIFAAGTGTLTIQNGSITSASSAVAVNSPEQTVILAETVTVKGADLVTVIRADNTSDVVQEQYGVTPVRVIRGTLVNHGTIIGGSAQTAVSNEGGELYNHGTIAGGSSAMPVLYSTFDAGVGVDGYHGVTLNTGIIRGGEYRSRTSVDEDIMCAPAVYGIVGKNTGTIIGGAAYADSKSVSSGPAVYGAVGLNTGEIRGGDAVSYAKEGTAYAAAGVVGWQKLDAAAYGYTDYPEQEAVVLENRGIISCGKASAESAGVTPQHGSAVFSRGIETWEVLINSGEIRAYGGTYAIDEMVPGRIVCRNSGIITPIALTQADLTVFIDNEIAAPDADGMIRLWSGEEAPVYHLTYTLMLGGKAVSFQELTRTLTRDGEEVSELREPGTYILTLTDGTGLTQSRTVEIAKENPFADVNEADVYYEDILYVYRQGLMNGTDGTHFSPDTTLSRAMLVTMLWRMEGCPAVDSLMPFTDVPADSWYTEAVRWAASEKIVEGYSDTAFGPTDPITREQFATILWRYAKYKGYDVSGGEDTNILSYEDAFSISEYA
ncbi:MAG: S-layer homology domain-containing protein, partial [Clostridia bacterium]|nr:S-layer homology domain-containing protein [Clostridia bacterium]